MDILKLNIHIIYSNILKQSGEEGQEYEKYVTHH